MGMPISQGVLLTSPSAAASSFINGGALSGAPGGGLPLHASTPPPLSMLSSSSSASPLCSLLPRHSTWDRNRGVSPDLIRSLMATAEAHELKASMANQKNKHIVAGAFAAASATDSGLAPLTKDKAEKLKELDYDFTMTGLHLLANLLSSLTVHNKRQVNAIPRMARVSCNTTHARKRIERVLFSHPLTCVGFLSFSCVFVSRAPNFLKPLPSRG
jgi:hypothetical protein